MSRLQSLTTTLCVVSCVVVGGCGEGLGIDDIGQLGSAVNITPVCHVSVISGGTTRLLDIETEYLTGVVMCENGDSPHLAALEAQAIAARTFTYYKTFVEQRPLRDSTADQKYSCDSMRICRDNPAALAKCSLVSQAVRNTAGKVLFHAGHIIAGSYQAGYCASNEGRSGAKCGTRGADPATCLRPAQLPLASPSSDYNRGCMSQNGSTELAAQGYTAERILAHYYGEDIVIHSVGATCPLPDVGSATPAPPLPGLEDVRWIGDPCTDDSQCVVASVGWSGFCRKGPGAETGFCTEACGAVSGMEPLCPDLMLRNGVPVLGYDRSGNRRWPMTFCAVEGNDLGAVQGICLPRCDYLLGPGGGCGREVNLVCQGKKRPAPSNVWRNACAPPPGKHDGAAFPPTPEGDLPNPEHVDQSGCTIGGTPDARAGAWLLSLVLLARLRVAGRRRRQNRPDRSSR